MAQAAGSVAVSPAEAAIALGDTLRLAAEARDANGHPVEGAEFLWASSDEAVATVDASGLATGVAAGEAAITATSDGVQPGVRQLTVLAPVPAEIAVTPGAVEFMALGDTAQLAVEVLDQFGRPMEAATVSWTSADTVVATVDAAGLVTAAGSGATVVTATAGDVSDEAAVSVMQTVGSVDRVAGRGGDRRLAIRSASRPRRGMRTATRWRAPSSRGRRATKRWRGWTRPAW